MMRSMKPVISDLVVWRMVSYMYLFKILKWSDTFSKLLSKTNLSLCYEFFKKYDVSNNVE